MTLLAFSFLVCGKFKNPVNQYSLKIIWGVGLAYVLRNISNFNPLLSDMLNDISCLVGIFHEHWENCSKS